MITFNKHYVTDGKTRARVYYSLDNRTDGRHCITMYAKDHTGNLGVVLAGHYTNNSDSQTDYFETGKAVLFETHPLYASARQRVENF